MCQTCVDLDIPERLWCGEKVPDNNFENDSLLRRFMVFGDKTTWSSEKKSAVVFPLRSDSYNKFSLCDDPTDVLFNTRAGDAQGHYVTHGILSISVNDINDINANPPEIEVNNVKRVFTLSPVHNPTICMYPHCELLIYENGGQVNMKAPKSIGVVIRDLLVEISTILKEPDAEVA